MASTPSTSMVVSGLPYFVWEVPDKNISIQLHFDVIDRMSPDILRGFGALKRRGAEVGGLLLGSSEDGPVRKVIVEDFEPVTSEYLTGPSYNLSPNDLVSFEAAIASHSGSGPKRVVGYYRSHTRDELFMDNADLDLAHRYFAGPENVFLIVKPFTTRPSAAGFFFWEDGEIVKESSYLLFPFLRRELGGGELLPAPRRPEPDKGPRPSVQAPPPEPGGALEKYRPAAGLPALSILKTVEAPAPPRTPLLLRLLAIPALMLAVAAGGFFAYSSLKAPQTNPETPLPLRLAVTDKNGQLDVTWNRIAAPVATAQRGVLSIADGSAKRDLELTGPQLRDGRVLYSRLSGDVSLRLEVFPAGRPSVAESIRIVAMDKPPQPRPLATAPPPPVAVTAERSVPAKKKKTWPALTPAPQTDVPPEVELQRPARRR